MVQTDVSWTIHTLSNGQIPIPWASNELSGVNNNTRGASATFEFDLIDPSQTLVVESGETYTVASGTSEIYAQKNVKENGTVNVEENGTLNITGGDGVELLQRYQTHAGSFATVPTLSNTIYYRNQIPDTANIGSLVVGIEPSQSLKDRDVNGIWGLISNVTDTRPQAITNTSYSLEITVLAEYSDYSDHTAIQSDLQA